jgi:hypothetical protein
VSLNLTPISQIKQLNPIDGSFTVFQDTTFGQRTYDTNATVNAAGKGVNTGGDMLPVQPVISESSLSVEGNKIAIMSMKQNPTPNRPAQGRLNVANGFQTQLSVTGVEELLRNIAQDQNPGVTYRGGGSQPGTHTLVVAVTPGTQTAPVTHAIVAIPTTFKFPVRLKATLSATPSLDSAAVKATVTISGKDTNGNTLTDVLTWTAATITTATSLETLDYFDPTETVTVVSKGFGGGEVAVTIDDPSKTITYTPNNDPTNFLAFEVNQGGKVPQSFMDAIIQQVEYGIAEDSIVANCGVISAFGRVRQNINGGDTPTPLSTGVSRASSQVYTGVESYLDIDGDRVAMENLTVAIVNGFDLPFYHNYSLWAESQPRRMELRMLTITATLPYDAVQDFETNYLQNRQVDNVRAVLATGAGGTFGAYDASLICEMTKGFQMSMPSGQGSGTTPLTQNVVIEAFTDGSEADYTLISNQPEQPYVLYNNS